MSSYAHDRRDVLDSVSVFARSGGEDYSIVIARFTAANKAPVVAERLAYLVPLAFGRAVLRRMGVEAFSETVKIVCPNGDVLEISLHDDGLFRAAADLAEESFRSGLVPRAEFRATALRSVELQAANEALATGTDIRGATALQSTIFSTVSADAWRQSNAQHGE